MIWLDLVALYILVSSTQRKYRPFEVFVHSSPKFVVCVTLLALECHPFACIQALWLKAKLIAWVMSVTGLGKVVSDQNPLPCN